MRRVIRHEDLIGSSTINVTWEREPFKRDMQGIRAQVEAVISGEDRIQGEFVYSQLVEQAVRLRKAFHFRPKCSRCD